MTAFATCEKHPGAVVVFDNIDECPVCKMIESLQYAAVRSGALDDRMEDIREILRVL